MSLKNLPLNYCLVFMTIIKFIIMKRYNTTVIYIFYSALDPLICKCKIYRKLCKSLWCSNCPSVNMKCIYCIVRILPFSIEYTLDLKVRSKSVCSHQDFTFALVRTFHWCGNFKSVRNSIVTKTKMSEQKQMIAQIVVQIL